MQRTLQTASILALAAALPAAEIAKGLTVDGWVDTTFSLVHTPNALPNVRVTGGASDPSLSPYRAVETAPGSGSYVLVADTTTVNQAYPYSTASASTDFAARAELTVGYAVTDRVQAQMALWFRNDGSQVDLREAFIETDLGQGLAWQIGKSFNHLGWVAGDPTGLYRVNESTIGYTGVFYGATDPLGTSLAWTSPGNACTTALFVTNGFYNAKDSDNLTSIDDGSLKPKNDVGLGLDVVGRFGADQASEVNLEVAYDARGGAMRTGGHHGAKYQLGLNTTVKTGGEADPLTLGAEVIYLATEYADTDANRVAPKQTTKQDLGALAMASYQLRQQESWPLALTGMYQRIDPAWGSDAPSSWTLDGTGLKDGHPYYHNNRVASNELTLGLLTNPFGDHLFALNAEVAYAFVDGGASNPTYYPVGLSDTRDGVVTVAFEALAVIP